MGTTLKEIYEDDQNDRENWLTNESREDILVRDRQRREIVKEMINSEKLVTGSDYYYAGMVFQHGETPEDFLVANELANKAVELGEERGIWLIAASEDRYLTSTKAEYQRYGTQYRMDKDSDKWYLYPVNPETTDIERAKYNVPPLEELKKREDEMNGL